MTTYPVFTTGTINATDGNFTGTVDIDTELDVTGATITGLSHTSLDDIGTNTHPQIDTHIANTTTNPHQVTLELAAAQTGITGLTKGDLLVYGGSSAFIRLAVGTDGEVLKANSSTASGLEWDTDSSGWTEATVQTTDATLTQIQTTATSSDMSYFFKENFTARCSVTGTHAAAGWKTESEWFNDGGTLSKLAEQETAIKETDSAAWIRSSAVSTTNIVSSVQGSATQTVEWKISYRTVSH